MVIIRECQRQLYLDMSRAVPCRTASARTTLVLPQPGGPCSNTPRAGRTHMKRISSARLVGQMMAVINIIICFDRQCVIFAIGNKPCSRASVTWSRPPRGEQFTDDGAEFKTLTPIREGAAAGRQVATASITASCKSCDSNWSAKAEICAFKRRAVRFAT
jgi:hypothetical protein